MPNNEITVKVIKSGPLMVEGKTKLKKANGDVIKESDKIFLCRCGASNNKPFCDGTHNKIDFE